MHDGGSRVRFLSCVGLQMEGSPERFQRGFRTDDGGKRCCFVSSSIAFDFFSCASLSYRKSTEKYLVMLFRRGKFYNPLSGSLDAAFDTKDVCYLVTMVRSWLLLENLVDKAGFLL